MKKHKLSILSLFLALLFSSCTTLQYWKDHPLDRTEPHSWSKKTNSIRKSGGHINPLYYSGKRNYLFT